MSEDESDFIDSMQLAAILAQIQQDDYDPIHPVDLKNNSQESSSTFSSSDDLTKYEYTVENCLDPTTFKLTRTFQSHLDEMHHSVQSQLPSLLSSIKTDTFTKSNTFFKTDNYPVYLTPLESSGHKIALYYDSTFNCFYDPVMNIYYDLVHA
jgi:hypothetical protein